MDSLSPQRTGGQGRARFIAAIERLALLIVLTVALILPLGYWTLAYEYLVYHVDVQARVKAGAITALVSGNPKLWQYELRRIEDLLAQYPFPVDDETASAFDARGARLASVGTPPAPPRLQRAHPLYDSGRVVGQVTVDASLRDLIYGTTLAALLGLLLAGAVHGVLRAWPMRALRRMSAALEAEHAALSASEQRYRTVADFTYDWEYWRSPDGSLPYVSPSCLRVTGFGAGEFQRDPALLLRIVHPTDRAALEQHLHEVEHPETNNDHYELDFRIITRAGDERWISHVCQPISDPQGKYLGRRACNRDVTTRKHVEQALRAREERLRTLFDRASDGILLLTPEGTLVAANDSFARMHGYSAHEMAGLDLQKLRTPETQRLAPERRRRILAGESVRFETEHYRKDGRVFPLEVTASLVRSEGTTLIQAFHRDISERKQAEAERAQLEEQLRQSQKMEALGTLAGGVAHDFNNALAAIFGNLELVRQDLGSGHAAQESLEEIGKATHRAKALVQQILAFGRRQPLQRKRISLAPIVRESARLLRSALPAGIELRVVCAPDAPQVMADALQVQQILLNLGTNAWQAIRSAHCSKRKSTGLIEVRLQAGAASQSSYAGPERRSAGKRHNRRRGHCAVLTVRDNGPGMDAATVQRIFEPFYTTKPAGEGSGLGLAVVHGIVQTHDAAIDVHSAPGRGTTFCVYFSAADEAPAAALQRIAAPAPHHDHGLGAAANSGATRALEGGGKHILFVDDDDAIVLLMTRLLERKGYRVSGYTDGHAALAAVRADPAVFDIAVSDYNMPGISGLDLARGMHRLRADLPVVIASGDITDEMRAEAPAAGVHELIHKPNVADDLCAAILRLANDLPAQT